MDIYIKERIFSWGDKFDVCDAGGEPRYFVQGEVFSWGKKLHIYDRFDREVAFIKQELLTLLPCYHVHVNGTEVARIRREWSFFRPRYRVEGLGWNVEGNFWEHAYQVTEDGRPMVSIEKEWMTWGDSYHVRIAEDADPVIALAVVVTIDCMIEQRNDN